MFDPRDRILTIRLSTGRKLMGVALLGLYLPVWVVLRFVRGGLAWTSSDHWRGPKRKALPAALLTPLLREFPHA